MILTDYYRFEKVAIKAKMRLDCIASTESYPPFEEKRADKAKRASEKYDPTNVGDLVVYYGGVPSRFGGEVHRKADKSITIKRNNLTSIYVPDPALNVAYGDVKGEGDAILFVFEGFDVVSGEPQQGSVLEMFIARGKSRDRVPLYNLLCDGELAEEMNQLRERATKHPTAPALAAASE